VRIVFTGYADIKAVIDAINHGGLYRYITKPWDPDELIEVLHEAAARYDEIAERGRLLEDLRAYISDGCELARACSAAGREMPKLPIDLDTWGRSGEDLSERLDCAIVAQATNGRGR
jgi:response regulator RpfG family c-di-GMP phosphodiesterase